MLAMCMETMLADNFFLGNMKIIQRTKEDESTIIHKIFETNCSFSLSVLSFKSFSNLWGNSYIPCLLLKIAPRFTCGGRKIG